jgi:mitochondrial fission protein ELM1
MMKYFFTKTWQWMAGIALLGALGLYLWPLNQGNTFLYVIYDESKAGDKNQVLGVANALKEHLPSNTLEIQFDVKKKNEFLTDVRSSLKPESKNKGIVIAAGVETIDIIKELMPQDNLVISHSSHQYTKEHGLLRNVADIVALPRYVVTPDIQDDIETQQTTLVQTTGVPHNLSINTINEAYQKNKDQIPSASQYMGVILGGDAPTTKNIMRYYTAKEAVQLAEYLSPIVKEKKAHLLIINGPRTGKHDQKTGKVIETSHRDGKPDKITTAFVTALEQKGLKAGQDFTLFDFQFDKPSVYPIILGALAAKKGAIFVAGESTSMVSESADCLPGLVTAFINDAMNENHQKHCLAEYTAGRVNILNYNKGWHFSKSDISDSQQKESAAKTIANAIKKRWDEKAAL